MACKVGQTFTICERCYSGTEDSLSQPSCRWQDIVAYAINPETITRIPIGTFRVFVEASISVCWYNCMSDKHRIEVDRRIHEIDWLDESNYEGIRDLVTKYVQLHDHELLQEAAGNTHFWADMLKDAIKHVLSFL